MKKNISLKETLWFTFISFALVIVVTVTLFTNIFLKDDFMRYMDSQNQDKMNEIINQLQTHQNPEALLFETSFANDLVSQGFILVLKQETVWFDGFEVNQDMIQQIKDQYQATEKQLLAYGQDVYSVYETTIMLNQQSTLVQIYNYRPILMSQVGLHHLKTMNQSFVLIGLVSFSFAIMLSLLLTHFLVKPIQTIIKKIVETKKGETVSTPPSKIREYHEIERHISELSQMLWYQKNLRKKKSTNLSHELRTPLTALSLTLENIEEGVWQYDERLHATIKEELKRLEYLVEDIHQLEQIELETYTLNKQMVEVEPIVQHVLEVLKPRIEEKQMKVVFNHQHETIVVDSKRFQQIIMNIVDNAIKYGQMRSDINISVTKQTNETIISIKDRGIGMSLVQQQLILNRYYRTHQTNERGSGIGLAIVKELVEAHGGQILIFSEVNQGTEVILIFKSEPSI